MPLKYSTDCEELAYHKDADALRGACDLAIGTYAFSPEEFFQAGATYGVHDVTWFTWHGDSHATALLFVGTEAEVISRLRKLDERPVDA